MNVTGDKTAFTPFILRRLVLDEGVTILVATHGPLLLDLADRVIVLSGARVVREG